MGNHCQPHIEKRSFDSQDTMPVESDLSLCNLDEVENVKLEESHEDEKGNLEVPLQSMLRLNTQLVIDRVKKNAHKDKRYKEVRDMCRVGLSKDERKLVYQKIAKAMGCSKSGYEETRKELMGDMKIEDYPEIPKFGDDSSHDIDVLEKQRAAKRILLLLSNEQPSVSYCPIIPNLVELFLWQVEEDETFTLVNGMAEMSCTTDWYFQTDAVGFKKGVEGFLVLGRQFAPKFVSQYEQFVTRLAEWWFKSFFEDYFTNERRSKLMDPFLFEGCEIVYKIGLSILKCCERKSPPIAPNLHKFELMVKSICEKDVDEILRYAWDLKIKKSVLRKYNAKFDANTGLVSIPRISYMIRSWPNFEDGDSKIISKKEFFGAWASLPRETNECSVSCIFSSDKHGYNLMTLRSKCKVKMHLLFFIQTLAGSKFGFYVRTMDNCHKAPRDDTDIRLFSLTPSLRAWKVEEKKSVIAGDAVPTESDQPSGVVFCDDKQLYVGDWAEKALCINCTRGTMEDGYSKACKSFKSPILVNDNSGMFQVSRLEAFSLSLFEF